MDPKHSDDGHDPLLQRAPGDAQPGGWLAPLRRFAEALTAAPAAWAPAAAALVLLLALVSWRAMEDADRVNALENELAATLRSLAVLKQDLARVSEDSSRQSQQLELLRIELSKSQAELASRPAAATAVPEALTAVPEALTAVPEALTAVPEAPTHVEMPAPAPGEELAATPTPPGARQPEKETAKQPAVVAINAPFVYQAPAGSDAGRGPSRSSALMRSPAVDLPEVIALAPDHVGLTVSASPALHWRLSSRTDRPLVVTVVDPRLQQTLLETKLRGPQRRGYGRISLSRHRVSLQPGRPYQWSVSVLAGDASAPNDPVASGLIERVSKTPKLAASLRAAGPAGAAQAYAEHGIWYDAVDALSQRIVRFPKDLVLRARRESLLKQVGLPEVAKN